MITDFKIFEKYNNNKLNELIIEYFNNESESIIEIIDSFESVKDVPNIFEKISFLIESLGDVEEIKEKAFYIDTKDKNERTFFFDVIDNKFRITTYNKFMNVNESLEFSDLKKMVNFSKYIHGFINGNFNINDLNNYLKELNFDYSSLNENHDNILQIALLDLDHVNDVDTNQALIETLLEDGAHKYINNQDKQGDTALFYTPVSLIKLMTQYSADWFIKNNVGDYFFDFKNEGDILEILETFPEIKKEYELTLKINEYDI